MSTLFSSDAIDQDISSSASSSYFSGEEVIRQPSETVPAQDFAPVRGHDGALNHSNVSNGGLPGVTRTSPIASRGQARKAADPAAARHLDVESENSMRAVLGGPGRLGSGASGVATKVPVNHQPPPQQSLAVSARSFAEKLAADYLACTYCRKAAADPVQVMESPTVMVLSCASCATSQKAAKGVAVVPLPAALKNCIQAVYQSAEVSTAASSAAKGLGDAHDAIANRRVVRVARDKLPSGSGTPTTPDAAAGAASVKPATATPAASATPAVNVALMLRDLASAEENERQQVIESSLESLASLRRHFISDLKVKNSRQLKSAADKKYEMGEYTAAVELYTKAIAMQPIDKMTKPNFLYGNRSAAHFMAQRYRECANDCLEVIKLEPENEKMPSRAAHAASFMGDLAWSVKILENVPAKVMTPSMTAELAKYRTGLELWRKAESAFGTPESDESYRMLTAQFPSTTAFRQRYAESLFSQRHYLRATEILEVLSSSARTPQVCKIMAQCMYLSGFEYFDRAFGVLREAAGLDKDCADLLHVMELVDEGKQKGNNNFANKKFSEAVEHYTKAIQHATGNDQILRILYCNRAAANKELGKYREGVDDCSKAIAIDPGFYKAYARRARCHQHLNDFFNAVKDFKKALENDSSDKDLLRELQHAEAQLGKEAEKEKDFYYQLGVSRTATEREIKVKYRELSLRWHPDKCVNMDESERNRAEHKFKVISEAYATLTDVSKRREYDLKFDREQRFQRGGGGLASTYGSDYFRGHAAPGTRHRAGNAGFW